MNGTSSTSATRGGAQVIPRPEDWRPGEANPWHGRLREADVTVAAIASAMSELAAGLRPALPPTVLEPPVLGTRGAAAVLIPLFTGERGETRVVLTRRSSRLRNHKGEVAFPGGRIDEGETTVEAALREAEEEIGLPRSTVSIIGEIEPLATVASRAAVTPIVGVVQTMPTLRRSLAPNPHEVDRVFDVGLLELTHPECYREEVWGREWGDHSVYFFEVEGDTIWGATGRMLHRLLTLLLPASKETG